MRGAVPAQPQRRGSVMGVSRAGLSLEVIRACAGIRRWDRPSGGDLSAERLVDAYRHGIFPWYNGGQPILWWSPNPRMVLVVDEFKLPRSLRKVVRQHRFEIRVDTAFRRVIAACAEARNGQSGTWITPQVIEAYTALHQLGYAHSVESWRDGNLVGGLYGVAIGHMFYGESMFARESDASKVAL